MRRKDGSTLRSFARVSQVRLQQIFPGIFPGIFLGFSWDISWDFSEDADDV